MPASTTGPVQQAYVGYVYGDSTCGQRAVYGVGLTGIPVFNVNNNCSTGSTALFLARQAVEGGAAECVLALGFEQMEPGALRLELRRPHQRRSTRFADVMTEVQGFDDQAPRAAQMFGGAGREYSEKYGTKRETFAQDLGEGAPARREATRSRCSARPLTSRRCWPRRGVRPADPLPVLPADLRRGRGDRLLGRLREASTASTRACYIAAQAMTTDTPSHLRRQRHDQDGRLRHGGAPRRSRSTRRPASAPRTSTSSSCTTASPPTSCSPTRRSACARRATAEKFICDGDNTYGGSVVTNPSGGLLSKGHPLGATGLAQCTELVWQLRGQAEQRQVEGASRAAAQPRPRRRLRRDAVRERAWQTTMIDRSHIGHVCRRSTLPVEAGRLRFFAKATGETDPVYIDEAAARDAGHPRPAGAADLPVLPGDGAGPTRPRCASCWASTTAASCTASRASPTTRRPTRATR